MNAISHIDAARLEQLKQEGQVVLLDVRTDAEVARGRIAGAKHIPLNELPGRVGELDAEGVTVIYCQSGGRSAQACAWLESRGFSRVHNLQGGILAWVRGGLPLEMPT